MLQFGSFRAGTCGGVQRRGFLKAAAALPFALSLGTANQQARAAESLTRAKSVLLVWLWGAPSHLDTFDPKPDAPAEYRGAFGTIPTQIPGVRFTELFPRLAQRNSLFSLVRSNVTTEPGHPDAGTMGLTGFREKPDPVQPSFGAIVAKHRGHSGALPPYVSVGRGIPRDIVRIVDGYGGGTLSKTYDPFMVTANEEGTVDIPALEILPGLSPSRIQDRRGLLTGVDDAQRFVASRGTDDWDRQYRSAYGLLTNPIARQAFDLTAESYSTRARYGQTGFGQSCLLARRLVEASVPFVQVNWSQYVEAMTPNCDFGWDTHIYNFELLQDMHGPIFDRAFAALLDDLKDHGLLKTTLVVAMGEFGRTPRISSRAARDHWPRCYFSIWAGAGIEGGRVIGASDKYGEDPASNPITPLMVGTTIAELAGANAQVRAELKVLEGGTPVHELVQ